MSVRLDFHFQAVKVMSNIQLRHCDLIARNSGNLLVNDPPCVSIYFAVIEANCRASGVIGRRKREKKEKKTRTNPEKEKSKIVLTSLLVYSLCLAKETRKYQQPQRAKAKKGKEI